MAVKLKSLERLAKTYTEQRYIYKDLALDLSQASQRSPGFSPSVPGTDIRESLDMAAIRNSLTNLFNTLPGQRFLYPEYGLDLYQFLFQPVTQSTGRTIGEKMLRGIERFESRVSVQNINIIADPDNSTYNITIVVEMPVLKQSTSLNGQLNTKTQSFIFLPTSRNT